MKKEKSLLPNGPTVVQNVNDAYSNYEARLGVHTQNLINASVYYDLKLTQQPQQLNNLYKSHWIVRRVVDVVPEDMTKNWFNLSASGLTQNQIQKFERVIRETRIRKATTDGLKWARLYGGAIGVIKLDGYLFGNMSKPLDLEKVTPNSFRGVHIIDRWSGIKPSEELVRDLGSTEFGLPEYYYIEDQHGRKDIKIHHSWVIRFIGAEVPRSELIRNSYWGDSVLETVMEAITQYDLVLNNMNSLTSKANLFTYKIDGFNNIFALGGSLAQHKVVDVIQAQSVIDSNLGMRVVDKNDEIQHLTYNFAGFSDVLSMNQYNVAGAAENLVSRIFGRSPGGLNATGEHEMRTYGEYIDEKIEYDLRPLIEQLLPIIAKSCWGYVPREMELIFPPYVSPDEAQEAVILERKVGSLLDVYNAGGIPKDSFMSELKTAGADTGVFQTITQDMIETGQDIWKINGSEDYLSTLEQLDEDETEETEDTDDESIFENNVNIGDGGPGSGNFNHGGRVGKVGGSTDAPTAASTRTQQNEDLEQQPESRLYRSIQTGERTATPFENEIIDFITGERMLDGDFKAQVDMYIDEAPISTDTIYCVVDEEQIANLDINDTIVFDTSAWTLSLAYANKVIEEREAKNPGSTSLVTLNGPHKMFEIKAYSPYLGQQEVLAKGKLTIIDKYLKLDNDINYQILEVVDMGSIAQYEGEEDEAGIFIEEPGNQTGRGES